MKSIKPEDILSNTTLKENKLSISEKQMMLDEFRLNIKKKSEVRKTSFFTYTSIAVAALLIGVLWTGFKILKSKTVVSVEKKSILLTDNTTVTLGENSKLTYNPFLFRFIRKVSIEGEAYFDVVQKGSFSVHAGDYNISVLGTQFSVSNVDSFLVTCFTGSVKVENDVLNRAITLYAGEQVPASLDETIKVEEKEPLWLNNRYNFDTVPLLNVISELEKQYKLKIRRDKSIEGLMFSGSFPIDNQHIALQLVLGPYDLKYKIENDTIIIY